MTSIRIPLCLLLITFSLFSSTAPAAEIRPDPGPNPPADFYSEAHRFVFFAVLEGCYNSGLTDGDILCILPVSPEGRREEYANFVLSCPVCSPALDAFALYSVRRPSSVQILKTSQFATFGPGLDESTKAGLAIPGQSCRDTIQTLIQLWVDQRIVRMRLTDSESASLREELKAMREEGERILQRFQNSNQGDLLSERYKDWKACPVCSGASPMGGVK